MALRTTLALDDDVVAAARAIAARERKTMGEVVSELARRSLNEGPRVKYRNGIPVFVRPEGSNVVITLELVNALRDDEE